MHVDCHSNNCYGKSCTLQNQARRRAPRLGSTTQSSLPQTTFRRAPRPGTTTSPGHRLPQALARLSFCHNVPRTGVLRPQASQWAPDASSCLRFLGLRAGGMMQTMWSVPEGSVHARRAFGLRACGLRADPANFFANCSEHSRAIRTHIVACAQIHS